MGAMGRVIFVAGTGTDVGKSHVVCAMLRAARSRNLTVEALKPVATGVSDVSEDDERHAAALGRASRSPRFAYEPPISPHRAARLAARPISVEPIASDVAELARTHDLVVVEGAGGLFSPLGPSLDNLSLALALAPARVVLVGSDRLGVLHDVAATSIAARTRGLASLEIVLSTPHAADASTGTNAEECVRLGMADVVLTFPRAADYDPRSLAIASALLDRLALAQSV